jgi:hypothetical protein
MDRIRQGIQSLAKYPADSQNEICSARRGNGSLQPALAFCEFGARIPGSFERTGVRAKTRIEFSIANIHRQF